MPCLELLCVLLFSSQSTEMCSEALAWQPAAQHGSLKLIPQLNSQSGLTAHDERLRFLDLAHNRLSHLPSVLPRSLWQLRASSSHLKPLGKNDKWNLHLLHPSANRLQRVTFINHMCAFAEPEPPSLVDCARHSACQSENH